MKSPSILVLCTGNSCRSQMAEGILRNASGGYLDVHSAGTTPVGYVHPLAIEILAQAGIDISAQISDHYGQFPPEGIDMVITVCDEAEEVASLVFEHAEHFHWSFGNPSKDRRGCETMLDSFRRVFKEMSPVFEAFAAGYRLTQHNAATPKHRAGLLKRITPKSAPLAIL